MKPFKASPALTDDLQKAYDYFRAGGSQAADRFLQRYQQASEQLIQRPEIFRERRNGWRQCAILRSSYAIFFRETRDFWLLAGVLSLVRDPDAIQAELLVREISPGDGK